MPHLHINEKTGISLHKLLLSCKGEALTDSAALHGVNTASKYLCHLNGFYFYLPIWFRGYWLAVSRELQWQTLQLQGQTLKEFLQLPWCLRCLLGFGVGSSQKGFVKGWICLKVLAGLYHHGCMSQCCQVLFVPKAQHILLKPLGDEHPAGGSTKHRGETTKKPTLCSFKCELAAEFLESLGFLIVQRLYQGTLTPCALSPAVASQLHGNMRFRHSGDLEKSFSWTLKSEVTSAGSYPPSNVFFSVSVLCTTF